MVFQERVGSVELRRMDTDDFRREDPRRKLLSVPRFLGCLSGRIMSRRGGGVTFGLPACLLYFPTVFRRIYSKFRKIFDFARGSAKFVNKNPKICLRISNICEIMRKKNEVGVVEKVCRSCRYRQELSNEYLLEKSASIQPRKSPPKCGCLPASGPPPGSIKQPWECLLCRRFPRDLCSEESRNHFTE